MAFNKHEDGYAAVWKGKTEKAPTPGERAGEGEGGGLRRGVRGPLPFTFLWASPGGQAIW